ncbi:unnamed protein product [Adineta ricciae]|uniref:IRG-type G domain-containing protein n=1 Tax=Adineta ricciae TaxID=249248 RepID=A0A815VLE4_ADIRI|nr:unnamed protein product [Adineta ricciae]CAF1533564.1 unnamed protein product [Adineta ricciae]
MSDYQQQRQNIQLTENDWRTLLRNGGIQALIQKQKDIENEYKNQPVLIALIGEAGCGKSTLIRRFMGMSPDDEGEPKIGECVSECTKEGREYRKSGTSVVYVDLPGVGSTTSSCAFTTPKEQINYCKLYRLHTVDYFVLLSHNKFTEQDKRLAKYITDELKKKFVFVQTKIDLLRLEGGNKLLEKRAGFDAVKAKIREQLQTQLAADNVHKIFLVSNQFIESESDGKTIYEYDQSPDYEFDRLWEAIQSDMISEDGLGAEKGRAFVLATGAVCESAIRTAANSLRKQKWGWATLSGVIGAVPIPGVSISCDIAIIVTKATDYFFLFGLNPINFMGPGTAKEKLTNLIQALYASLGVRASAILGTMLGISAGEESVKAVPVVGVAIGSFVGAGVSFASTCVILGQVIDFCEKEALKLIHRN